MRIIDCHQGSDSWWEAKRGIPSASNFDKIIGSCGYEGYSQAHGEVCGHNHQTLQAAEKCVLKLFRQSPSAGWDTRQSIELSGQADGYIAELLADVFCQSPPYFTERGRPVNSVAVQNGIDTEPAARRWYEMETDADVAQVGFCLMDDGRFGCSPDGLVGEAGGLELKCPLLKTHVAYLLDGSLPAEYRAQVHGSLIVTGRDWWDFVSYSPPLPPLRIRVMPDEYTEKLRAALEQFHSRYAEALRKIREKIGGHNG